MYQRGRGGRGQLYRPLNRAFTCTRMHDDVILSAYLPCSTVQSPQLRLHRMHGRTVHPKYRSPAPEGVDVKRCPRPDPIPRPCKLGCKLGSWRGASALLRENGEHDVLQVASEVDSLRNYRALNHRALHPKAPNHRALNPRALRQELSGLSS